MQGMPIKREEIIFLFDLKFQVNRVYQESLLELVLPLLVLSIAERLDGLHP
jgi:hypothetical protein